MSAAKKSKLSGGPLPSAVSLPSQPLPMATSSASNPGSSSSTSQDQVQSAVLRYLQKRRYSPSMAEAYRKLSSGTNGVKLCQTKQQMAMREVLRSEASTVASLALSAPSNVDPLVIEQQYTKFKVWISESLDSYKPELAQLLYPLFTHLYLDLIDAGHKLVAQKFHKRHQSTFLGNPNFASFIRILSNVQSADDVPTEEAVAAFKATRYSVTLCNRTFHYLMRYLQHQQSVGQPPVLLHILHAKVDVRLADALGASSSKYEAVQRVRVDLDSAKLNNYDAAGRVIKKEDDLVNGCVGTSCTDSVSRLNEVIRAVRSGPSTLPTTCLYRISGQASGGIASARVSGSGRSMVTGCLDSSVVLWDLLPPPDPADASAGPAGGDAPADDPTVLRLGCDGPRCAENQRKSVMRAHGGPVFDAAFVPRGDHVVSVGEDTTMRLWDVDGGVNKVVYRGHTYPVWTVDSDRVGVNLATGSMDKTAKLWHLEYTFPLRVYAGHERDVDVVRFHPNCNYLATGGADKTVRLWSHADARMVRVFTGHKGGVRSLAFSPDGKLLASAGDDRRVRVWDLASANVVKECRGHASTVYSLVWSADSSLLASGGLDGCLKMWDVKTGASCPPNGPAFAETSQKSDGLLASNPTGCDNLLALCYSPHNTLIAAGSSSASSPSPVPGLANGKPS